MARLRQLRGLGLGYLTLDRATPTLSAGELQRLRLATQLSSLLFGVVYVLDEPFAGLHHPYTQALSDGLARLREAGKIGRATDGTPVPNAHTVFGISLEKTTITNTTPPNTTTPINNT